MLRILIANSKGGCGKTTLATNLSVAYAQGGFNIALADGDRQGSSLTWLKGRPKKAPAITGLDWRKQIDAPGKSIQRLVIDAPAGIRVKGFKELLGMADVVLVPVLPSAFDRQATLKFIAKIEDLRPIRKSRKPVAIIANRVRKGTRGLKTLVESIEKSPHPLIARLGDRALYPEVAEVGLGVFDRANISARSAQQDWTPIITFIETAMFR